jgi:uncharacterized protein (DUF2225 family)
MADIAPYYNTHIDCPVCDSRIEYTKIRSKAIKLVKQDTDFCPYYESENPMFYEAVICPECGYGAHITNFNNINKYGKARIREKITKRWTKRSFTGQRNINKALEAFKLVLLNLTDMEGPKSEMAKICMRIAWLYRYKNDSKNEKKFLEHALKNYMDAYGEEDLTTEGKIDQYTCLFIIGELCKRLNRYEESVRWFSRLIMYNADQQHKDKIPQRLIDTARDLFQEVKDIMAAAKEETN